MSSKLCLLLERLTNRQTSRQTNRLTDRPTERIITTSIRLESKLSSPKPHICCVPIHRITRFVQLLVDSGWLAHLLDSTPLALAP